MRGEVLSEHQASVKQERALCSAKTSVLPQNARVFCSSVPFCVLGDGTLIGVREKPVLISHVPPWAFELKILPADCPLISIIWGL